MTFPSRFVLGLMIVGLASGALKAQESPARPGDGPPRFNIVDALGRLPERGHVIKIEQGTPNVPEGGHVQGIQVRRGPLKDVAILSHDSRTVAYFVVAEFPGRFSGNGRVVHVQPLPGDGESPPLRHAGGIQLCGDVLAVGVEDNQARLRSEIQFWNLQEPETPRQLSHLTIRRRGAKDDQTAGAVGLVQRERDHVLAVANWDSRAIDFYRSDGKPLQDPGCRFSFAARWDGGKADRSDWEPDGLSGSYQAINLVCDALGELYLLGFYTAAPSKDVVDLFHASIDRGTVRLRKQANKHVILSDGNRFQYGGGAMFHGNTMIVLSTEARLDRGLRLNVIAGEE